MAYYEGLPHVPFKAINLKSGDGGGLVRFHGTTTITPSDAAATMLYVKYVGDKRVLHFWDGVENRRAESGFMFVQTITATATLTAQDCGIILAAPGTDSLALTLPDPASAPNGLIIIKNTSPIGGNVSVKAPAGKGIDATLAGVSVILASKYDRLLLASNGSDSWLIIANS